MATRRADHASARDLVARLKAGKPVFAWDDPQEEEYHHGPPIGDSRSESTSYHRHRQPPFYDQEALEEKLRGLKAEGSSLSEKEAELRERLAKAEATLSAMRAKKRDLSTVKLLDEINRTGQNSSVTSNRREPSLFKKRQDQDGGHDAKDARTQRQEELTNFAAKDRIMELELFNDQLRKGQAKAESEARSQEAASRATKADLNKHQQRLQAMPKRFTESLQLLREEVENLEREKLSLELAKQQRSLKEADQLASTKRRQAHLNAELNTLLDEIDDVEDDRDQWKRRLRVESTRAESLQSQRDQALGELRACFGEDAVERAAFASAACRKDIATRSRTGDEGWDGDVNRCAIPLSTIAAAIRPAYEPDEVLLTTEAVMEASQACGINSSSGENGQYVSFEEFCAVVERLRRKDVACH